MRTLTVPEIKRHCRNLCRTDLYFLLRYGLRREDAQNQWILNRCREVQADPNGHLDLWAREHYKSTIITFAQNIQDILVTYGEDDGDSIIQQTREEVWNDQEVTIGILSHTRPVAKGFLRQIKFEFEQNKLLYTWFPDVLFEDPVKESPKWSEDEGIIVRRTSNPKEATVEAWGLVDGQPTSKHFRVLVYDDVVTERSVTTSEMIAKTTRAWELSTNLGAIGGYKRYAGTRYDDADTYDTMLKRGVAIPRIHPGTKDGTANGEPVLMTPAALAEKRKEMSAYTFSCQILQNPEDNEDAYFKMVEGETLRWYDPQNPPQYTLNYGTTDGATSHGEGDWTVHLAFGVDPNDDVYLWDLWRDQEDSDVWVDAQIDMVLQWGPIQKWVGESGAIEKAVGPFRRKRMRERKTYFTYETLPSIQNKVTRATAFQGRWNQEKIYLPRGAPWVTDYLLELRRFPNSVVDDQVDASSLIGRMLDVMYKASAPRPPQVMIPGSPEYIMAQVKQLQQKRTGLYER